MTERLVIKCAYGHRAEAGEAAYAELQAEVQASRKLVADLLALAENAIPASCPHTHRAHILEEMRRRLIEAAT